MSQHNYNELDDVEETAGASPVHRQELETEMG